MAKLTAWLVTLIGVLLVLPLIGVSQLDTISEWIVPLAVLAIGIGKLVRNYKK
jgi:general stress protein CsbA